MQRTTARYRASCCAPDTAPFRHGAYPRCSPRTAARFLFPVVAGGLCSGMATVTALPLFHLYGDPPDDQAFDFIHVETIASRSSAHDWLIRAHRHRNLFQILLIERGGGEMTFEAATLPFAAPAAILVPPTTAHGFRFHAESHRRLGGELHRGRGRGARRALRRGAQAAQGARRRAGDPAGPRERDQAACRRCATICTRKASSPARAFGWRCAGLLALIAIEVARLAASRARTGVVTLAPADATVEALRRLVEEHFRKERLIGFYAEKLAITPDRLNDHVKRVQRGDRRSPDPPARPDRGQARAGVHRPADPRDFLRSRLRRPLALRALLSQADRA